MPKRQFKFTKGKYYHIYNRGAARASIFYTDENYRFVLRLMAKVIAKSELSMIAYCLLPNHYHWLVRQDGNVSARNLPKRVFGSYSQAFNHTYNRSGTLFEGPYNAIVVESNNYLRNLCRYIHCNAVKHEIAAAPELWPYSNYLEWIGARPGKLIDRTFVKAHFDSADDYRAYVQAYLTDQARLPRDLNKRLINL